MPTPFRSISFAWSYCALAAGLAVWFPPGPRLQAECRHIDDPFQLVEIQLTMDPADWDQVRRDSTWSLEKPATFRACGEDPLPVKVRRKKALLVGDDPAKPPLKIDFDDVVEDAEWHSHRKLSLESGNMEKGLPSVLLREGLAWHLMRQAGVITGGFSWVRLRVNGSLIGVYTRVEQVDKSFLRRRLGEDEGFLYKHEFVGPTGLSRLTRENEKDPYAADLCFPPFGQGCAVPADAVARAKEHLDVRQLLGIGAVNAALGNTDGLFSTNNFYVYNSERPRLYFPWDLDVVFLVSETLPPDPGWPSQTMGGFLLGVPSFREEYFAILRRLVRGPLSVAAIGKFLDGLGREIGPAMDADPNSGFEGGFAAEVANVKIWVARRVAYLESALGSGSPSSIVINEVLASNRQSGTDEAGNASDWVEIQNRGDATASLAGLFLTDDPAEPLKWPFPGGELPPGGTQIVWCDKDTADGPFHTGFQLDAKGEAVGLYTVVDGIPRALDFVAFGPQEIDVSFGRSQDGSAGFGLLPCPTPGARNDQACPVGPTFVRGDAEGDGRLSLTDAIAILGFLFLGDDLSCQAAADADGDDRVSLTDAVSELGYLFRGGPRPPAPFPGCGRGSALPCTAHEACGG